MQVPNSCTFTKKSLVQIHLKFDLYLKLFGSRWFAISLLIFYCYKSKFLLINKLGSGFSNL